MLDLAEHHTLVVLDLAPGRAVVSFTFVDRSASTILFFVFGQHPGQ